MASIVQPCSSTNFNDSRKISSRKSFSRWIGFSFVSVANGVSGGTDSGLKRWVLDGSTICNSPCVTWTVFSPSADTGIYEVVVAFNGATWIDSGLWDDLKLYKRNDGFWKYFV